MKKVIFSALLLLLCSSIVSAQEYDEKKFTIVPAIFGGVGGSTETNEDGTLFGGDIRGEYFASDFYRITLSAGYLRYTVKDNGGSSSIIPVLVGVKRHFSEPFYVATEFGIANLSNGVGIGFTYAVGLGFIVKSKVDLSLKFQNISKDGSKFLIGGLRVGYRL